MLLTPLLSGLTAPVYGIKRRLNKKDLLETVNLPVDGLHDHIVIAGGGQVGQHVAYILRQLNVPFVVIDLSHRTIEQCKQKGYPAIYGDAGHEVVLEAANLAEAKQLLVTLPHITTTETIVRYVHQTFPELKMVVRAVGNEQRQALYEDGVYMVIQPELEAGLEIARQTLLNLKLSVTEIQRFTDAARREHYHQDYENQAGLKSIRQLKNAHDLLQLSWEELGSESLLIGRSLRQLDMRQMTGASVVGVLRQGKFITNPSADLIFKPGDMVAVIGTGNNDASLGES
jgi:CPA2 family monovalent cation:H+ antiporter-2